MCDYSERLDVIENGLRELGLRQCEDCGDWKKELLSVVVVYCDKSEYDRDLCIRCYDSYAERGKLRR